VPCGSQNCYWVEGGVGARDAVRPAYRHSRLSSVASPFIISHT
jgi:hypothetical protein